jgi:hypothetical protein
MFNLLDALSGAISLGTGSTNSQPVPSSSSSQNSKQVPNSPFQNESDVVKVSECEIGSSVLLRSLDGETFEVFVLSADVNDKKVLIKQKVLLVLLAHQLAEIIRLPHRVGYGSVQNVYELQALHKLRYRANPSSNTESNNSFLSVFSALSSTPSSSAPSSSSASGLLVLELKSGKILKYYLNNPLPCVESIKMKMKILGLEGHYKHKEQTESQQSSSLPLKASPTSNNTSDSRSANNSNEKKEKNPINPLTNASEEDLIAIANYYLEESKQIEKEFNLHPSHDLIEEMMNLFRLTVEHFANVPNNYNYEKIIYCIQSFLIRDDVVQILEENKKLKKDMNALKVQKPFLNDDYEIVHSPNRKKAMETAANNTVQNEKQPIKKPPQSTESKQERKERKRGSKIIKEKLKKHGKCQGCGQHHAHWQEKSQCPHREHPDFNAENLDWEHSTNGRRIWKELHRRCIPTTGEEEEYRSSFESTNSQESYSEEEQTISTPTTILAKAETKETPFSPIPKVSLTPLTLDKSNNNNHNNLEMNDSSNPFLSPVPSSSVPPESKPSLAKQISQEIFHSPTKSLLFESNELEQFFLTPKNQNVFQVQDEDDENEIEILDVEEEEGEEEGPAAEEELGNKENQKTILKKKSSSKFNFKLFGGEDGGADVSVELSELLEKIDHEFYEMISSFTPAAAPKQLVEDGQSLLVGKFSLDEEIERLLSNM